MACQICDIVTYWLVRPLKVQQGLVIPLIDKDLDSQGKCTSSIDWAVEVLVEVLLTSDTKWFQAYLSCEDHFLDLLSITTMYLPGNWHSCLKLSKLTVHSSDNHDNSKTWVGSLRHTHDELIFQWQRLTVKQCNHPKLFSHFYASKSCYQS